MHFLVAHLCFSTCCICMCWKCILGSSAESRIQCRKYIPPWQLSTLPSRPFPLPGNSRWNFFLPDKITLTKDQNGFQASQQCVRFTRVICSPNLFQSIHLMSAWLHSLVINFAHLSHTQHIRPFRLKQSMQIAVKYCRRIEDTINDENEDKYAPSASKSSWKWILVRFKNRIDLPATLYTQPEPDWALLATLQKRNSVWQILRNLCHVQASLRWFFAASEQLQGCATLLVDR